MLSSEQRARILLIEADFEYPTMHELTGVDMPAGAGFSQQIRRRIRGGERKPWVVVRCSPTLDLLVEGALRSPGVLFSQEFGDAVRELRRTYDIIVIDAPVIGSGIEHKPIDSVTDGLVVVGRIGDELSEILKRTARRFQPKALVAAVHSEAATSEPPPAAR
jgi:Mrp family chromosome partitioning ATPase